MIRSPITLQVRSAEMPELGWGALMASDGNPELVVLLARIDERITELRDLVVEQRSFKDRYSTAEAAQVVKRSEFTVREWCRLGRIRAEKRQCGRGRSQEWMINHEEMTRIRNEGLLPLAKN